MDRAKYYRNRWYRKPKTKNERTQNPKGVGRPKRNSTNLPTNWDDQPISSRFDKSWKRRFKTQYRPKPK